MDLREKITAASSEAMAARRALCVGDPQRTLYHCEPHPSWMNDPISTVPRAK